MNYTLIPLLRKSMKVSQKQLAKKTKISRDTIIDIENGKGNPSLATIELLLDELGCELRICLK